MGGRSWLGWAMGLFMLASAARGETVILQQGRDNYTGCTDATLVGPKAPKDKSPQNTLNLRGSNNRAMMRFDLPPTLKDKKLARARLEVFVHEARNLRMICEILCREARSPWTNGPATLDTTTDYANGRPAGAMDSYSLWEFNGQYFPHRYEFLGLPKEGKWIDFNVTPAAKKWLSDPASNLGVALEPIDLGDKRFLNSAAIDIPSASSTDADHRPRLVLDFEPLDKPYLVGMTHALERYCDRDTRYRFQGPFEEKYELAMARNEYEPFQVLVYPMIEPLKGVTLECGDLLGANGAKIPAEDITWNVQEVFQLHPNNKIKDWYFHGKNFELPDPLSAARPTNLPLHMATPFWCTVRTRPATKAGVYRGTITANAENAPPRELQLTVKVWDYVIPEQWNFQTMGQTCWGPIWNCYPKLPADERKKIKRRYIDFLLDHRFNPTEQYVDKLSPDIEDLAYCQQRGANTIYLSGNYAAKGQDALVSRYQQIDQLGLIDQALVYIGDETNKWDEMRRRSDAVRKVCPELMIMIGGSFPRPELEGIIDIFDPQIDMSANKVYSLPADAMRPLIARSQGAARSSSGTWPPGRCCRAPTCRWRTR